MKETIVRVSSEVASNPKVTGVIASGFLSQWFIDWGSVALQLFTSLLGIAALSVSLAVNIQKFMKNHRERRQENQSDFVDLNGDKIDNQTRWK